MIKVSTQKITTFLNGISDVDFQYLKIAVDMANSAQTLIRRYGVTKKDFCERMEIKPREYDAYLNGSRRYDMEDMVALQMAWNYFELEKRAGEGVITYEKS